MALRTIAQKKVAKIAIEEIDVLTMRDAKIQLTSYHTTSRNGEHVSPVAF
jgi:hypothetical protein